MKIPGSDEEYPDFKFDPDPINDLLPYKRAWGELRVPSLVAKSRDLAAQAEIRGTSGEHAGHLIATRFGAPGGKCNLSIQNPNMNTYTPRRYQEALGKGGAYLQLEHHWANLLETGLRQESRLRIRVYVEDRYYPQHRRPFERKVKWWLKEGDHDWVLQPDNIIYGNFPSPQGRAVQKTQGK